MKKITTLLILILSVLGTSNAQTLKLFTKDVNHNDNLRPSIEIVLSPTAKAVKHAWKDFVEDNYRVDVDGIGLFSNRDVLVSERVLLPNISEKKIDLYAKVVSDQGKTRMNIFAAYGYDFYIDPYDNRKAYKSMREMATKFVQFYLPDYYNEVIEEARDEVSDLNDDIEDISKSIEKNKLKITDLKQENIELNLELDEARKALAEAERKLKEKKNKFEKTKDKISKVSGLK